MTGERRSGWTPRSPSEIATLNVRFAIALAARGDQRIMQFIENALRGTPYECPGASANPNCTWNLRDEELLRLLEQQVRDAETRT